MILLAATYLALQLPVGIATGRMLRNPVSTTDNAGSPSRVLGIADGEALHHAVQHNYTLVEEPTEFRDQEFGR